MFIISCDYAWQKWIFFSLSGRCMPKLLKIVFTLKFHPLHAKISTPTGTPVPDEKVKEISSSVWVLLKFRENKSEIMQILNSNWFYLKLIFLRSSLDRSAPARLVPWNLKNHGRIVTKNHRQSSMKFSTVLPADSLLTVADTQDTSWFGKFQRARFQIIYLNGTEQLDHSLFCYILVVDEWEVS